MRSIPALVAVLSFVAAAGEAEFADLRVRLAAGEVLRYACTTNATSDCSGREQGKPFTLRSDSTFGSIMVLKGLAAARPSPGEAQKGSIPLSLRLEKLSVVDKRSVDDSSIEVQMTSGKFKCIENGKVTADSENDIGVEKMAGYQERIKAMESAEVKLSMDAVGHQGSATGDPVLLETIQSNGAHGLFIILAGREVRPGESWDEHFTVPRLGEVKLTKPINVNSKMTFSRWVEREGKKFAEIEMVSAWENEIIRGEGNGGLLAEISHIDGRSAGTCLFDPATGHYIEGTMLQTVKYHMDGEREGQTTGLDVSGKTNFTFKLEK